MLLLTAAAEMVVLFVQLHWEDWARQWKTPFAFVDAGISWAQAFNQPTIEGASAEYSVIVITSVLGRARVRKTHFAVVLSASIALTALILIVMVLTLFRLKRMHEMKQMWTKSRQINRPKPNEYLYRVLERMFPADRDRARKRVEAEEQDANSDQQQNNAKSSADKL
ncbi:hypothetical protein FGB62_3g337 [Gracilaria domingensis]|nr:hypothetical protein FGB62_3g337 [Gracilaria domingensis]